MKPFLLPLAVCALVLAGCATTPTPLSESQPIRPDRYYPDYQLYAKPTPHAAKVIVVRDDGFVGSAAKAKVLVDGHELAGLFQHDRLEFYVSAGDHILSADPTPNFGVGAKEHQFVFRADQTSYFRISVDNSGFDIQPTALIQ